MSWFDDDRWADDDPYSVRSECAAHWPGPYAEDPADWHTHYCERPEGHRGAHTCACGKSRVRFE